MLLHAIPLTHINSASLSFGGGLCDEVLSLNYVGCVITPCVFSFLFFSATLLESLQTPTIPCSRWRRALQQTPAVSSCLLTTHLTRPLHQERSPLRTWITLEVSEPDVVCCTESKKTGLPTDLLLQEVLQPIICTQTAVPPPASKITAIWIFAVALTHASVSKQACTFIRHS